MFVSKRKPKKQPKKQQEVVLDAPVVRLAPKSQKSHINAQAGEKIPLLGEEELDLKQRLKQYPDEPVLKVVKAPELKGIRKIAIEPEDILPPLEDYLVQTYNMDRARIPREIRIYSERQKRGET